MNGIELKNDYEHILVTVDGNYVEIRSKKNRCNQEIQTMYKHNKDSTRKTILSFIKTIGSVKQFEWKKHPLDDTIVWELMNIEIGTMFSLTGTIVSVSKPLMARFVAKNSKKVKVTEVQLADELHTDEPVSLCGPWNKALLPTEITDSFLNQYNVSNLSKKDRTLLLSGLLNTKLTMKGIEDFAKRIPKQKEDHVNVDYGIIGYDQLEHLAEYKNKQEDISWDDKLVNWNGQSLYKATLLIRTGWCSSDPVRVHKVSVSLERSSTGIAENVKLPLSIPSVNEETLFNFQTISKAVSLKFRYSSLVPMQYEFSKISIKLERNSDKKMELNISTEQTHKLNMSFVRTGVTPEDVNHLIARFLKICKDTTYLELSGNIPLTDEFYDLLKEHASNMTIMTRLYMRNAMSPGTFLNLLDYAKSLKPKDLKTVLFINLDIGQNLNRDLCTDEIFMKLVSHEVQRVSTVYGGNHSWSSLYSCIPDISIAEHDYVEVKLTDALLMKMAERPDNLPKKIDLRKTITKFTSKGLEALLESLGSSNSKFDYDLGVIGMENLSDIDRLFDKVAAKGQRWERDNEDWYEEMNMSQWSDFSDISDYEGPLAEYQYKLIKEGRHDKKIVVHPMLAESAEQYFLQKLNSGQVNAQLVKECCDYSYKGKLTKLKDAVESHLIKDFQATHNMEYIQYGFKGYNGKRSYNHGFDKYKDTLLSFFSSTTLADPIMIAGREYVLALPNDARGIILEYLYKNTN